MPGDFPAEEHILDFGPLSYIVFDHVTATLTPAINNDSDVWDISAEVKSDQSHRGCNLRCES